MAELTVAGTPRGPSTGAALPQLPGATGATEGVGHGRSKPSQAAAITRLIEELNNAELEFGPGGSGVIHTVRGASRPPGESPAAVFSAMASNSDGGGGGMPTAALADDSAADGLHNNLSATLNRQTLSSSNRRLSCNSMSDFLDVVHEPKTYISVSSPFRKSHIMTDREGSTFQSSAPMQESARAKTAQSSDSYRDVNVKEYIQKRRQIGMLQMSLNVKRKEIKKLDEECELAEKRVQQQHLQLLHTKEKFQHFLKHSNLEQDAAVKKADAETRSRQEKLVEIKRLSSLIASIEAEQKRLEEQLERCLSYKVFLDKLTKSAWFYTILQNLLIEDAGRAVADEAEELFALEKAAIQGAYQAREDEEGLANTADTALQSQSQPLLSSLLNPAASKSVGKGSLTAGLTFAKQSVSSQQDRTLGALGNASEEAPPVVPLAEALSNAHEAILERARIKVEETVAAIKAEVNSDSMPLEEVQRRIESEFDPSRVPMYFKDPHHVLDIFISVEEENLFLIQNCQELEEELEHVSLEFFNEHSEMQRMVLQRREQMESIAAKIKTVQQQLQVIEMRIQNTMAREPTTVSGGGVGGGNSSTEKAAPKKTVGQTEAGGGGESLTQDDLKQLIESKVTALFRALAPSLSTLSPQAAADSDGPSARSGNKANTTSPGAGARSGLTLPAIGTPPRKAALVASESKHGNAAGTSKSAGSRKKPAAATLSPSRSPTSTSSSGQANMDALGMLTIIEARLEAMHSYLVPSQHEATYMPRSRSTNPNAGVDPTLIISILKANDKERRRQARLVLLQGQAQEQEEHRRRALERSQAPAKKMLGKPVMWRSRPPYAHENVDSVSGTHRPMSKREDGRDAENVMGAERAATADALKAAPMLRGTL